ncbi:MAG: hypothetical protein IJC24_05815 [Clostridia bacterium]|nr:hypothetical protein [Clostridia bacterium]
MEGRETHAEKAIYGIYKKTLLQQKNCKMLCSIYNIANADVLPAYKADMGADMGRYIYRTIQAVYYRKIFIEEKPKKK